MCKKCKNWLSWLDFDYQITCCIGSNGHEAAKCNWSTEACWLASFRLNNFALKLYRILASLSVFVVFCYWHVCIDWKQCQITKVLLTSVSTPHPASAICPCMGMISYLAAPFVTLNQVGWWHDFLKLQNHLVYWYSMVTTRTSISFVCLSNWPFCGIVSYTSWKSSNGFGCASFVDIRSLLTWSAAH